MLAEPKCFTRSCKHFLGAYQPDKTEESEIVICEAFPAGIPDEIAYGNNKHLTPYPGQENKIVYEPNLEKRG